MLSDRFWIFTLVLRGKEELRVRSCFGVFVGKNFLLLLEIINSLRCLRRMLISQWD